MSNLNIQSMIDSLSILPSYQVVVIGSGPGGSITACLLAEAGYQVLLIEEGEFLPLESCQPFSQDEMLQKYRNGGITATMGNPKIQYVEGRCVGGGSEINSGLYYRTPPEILEKWQKEFQVEGIDLSDLVPHFEAGEKDVNVCYLPGAAPPASLKLQTGADKLGWKASEVPRWFRYQTSETSDFPRGTRQSMTKTFIPRALKAGCQILPNTRVQSLVQEAQKWRLRAKYQGQRGISIEAETVFVAAGAIQTPALLRRSGIKQNVGNSLQMHPTIKVIAQFPERVNSDDMGVPVHQVKEFSPRFSFGCSISSRPYLALGLNDHPLFLSEVNEHWQNMGIYYAMITSQGKGTVRCLPKFNDPLVRYFLTEEDLQILSKALRKLCYLLFESGAKVLYPSIARSQPFKTMDDLKMIPEILPRLLTNLMTIHLFSSCPMGENQAICATDSFGRVHGFKNLYIADASLLCTAPGVNPQGSIMAITRRNVLRFMGKL